MSNVVILGSSRGLGAGLVHAVCQSGRTAVGFARKPPKHKSSENFTFVAADFAKAEGQESVLRSLAAIEAEAVFCVAGGGPYGLFHERGFKDHLWAWEVSFLFYARVLHALACAQKFPQVILVGSAVAETQADPRAASYAAAKHALHGLYQTLRAEYPSWDLRLFSPGYMDTEMLPSNAAVRQKGVYPVEQIARELWEWSLSADYGGHKVYPKHPS